MSLYSIYTLSRRKCRNENDLLLRVLFFIFAQKLALRISIYRPKYIIGRRHPVGTHSEVVGAYNV